MNEVDTCLGYCDGCQPNEVPVDERGQMRQLRYLPDSDAWLCDRCRSVRYENKAQ